MVRALARGGEIFVHTLEFEPQWFCRNPKSDNFPSTHYFALFIGRCINGKDEACHMCVPDLCVLKSVVSGYKGYNLGAIVARRLHNNGISVDLFGGIYATRVANYLGIPPRQGDIELPAAYLDFDALARHCFLVRNEQFLQYRLIFDIRRTVHVTLPAPSLFDYQAKHRYVVTTKEATEHEGRAEAARQHAAAQEAVATASQYDPSYKYGYQPCGPWYYTNLGQKPKLGGVCISH